MNFGDGSSGEVQWFFAAPGAKPFPGLHRFGSLNWLPEDIADDGPGEVLGAARPWANGSYPVVPEGQEPDGPLEDFRIGCDFERHPTLELNDVGIPVACVPRLGAYSIAYDDAFDV